MKKAFYGIIFLMAASPFIVNGYTFKVCYNGGRADATDVPDQIDVSTVIHGGSMCFAKLFSILALVKNSYQLHEITPGVGDWAWCRIVPETVTDNGQVKSISGNWLLPSEVPPTGDGQTWQIQKMKDNIITFTDPLENVRSFTISWDGYVQNGIQDCAPAQ